MPAVITNCLFTSLAFVVVCFRLGTRVFVVKNVGADDLLIVLAILASIGFLVVFMLQVKAGLGRAITVPELPGFLQALWATIPIYNLALMLCKLSITVQCYRVLRTPRTARFLRVYMGVLAAYGAWSVLGNVFVCWPVGFYWLEPTGTLRGACMDKGAVTFSNAALNIASDLVLIAVPVSLLWRLQLPRRQKMVLVCLFSGSAFACVTSIVRLHALYTIAVAPPAEQSVEGVDIAIWSSIEINVGIICASLPALKPLAAKLFPRLLLSGLYARTKEAAPSGGREAVGGSSGSGSHGGRRSDHTASEDAHSGHRAEIRVSQSFEMTSAPATAVPDTTDLETGTVAAIGTDDGQTSRDGSERNLVSSSWHGDGCKMATVMSDPHDMV
ncbi:hypothetical protein B0T26DRAFT_638721 [Lasiosphaeria miniovina]|uniref:Rhodopsin domain-containing protein n=1 Tax=Lasiosphaeria miniovina TaxID=1954250 RepID=A0AA40E8C4_9PEZI|nr:uncharacterized protein B0T26DRAFT_638721 [Lasiosphaeria miniovina]KAK0728827.1 hypothetical protein B0T26DRAFT_638721 [Lasiosphaeria miniovina]